MSAVDRLADGLLRSAARRWPTAVRAERLREWNAELHSVRHDAGTTGPARAARQLRFAASLACAPPVNDDGVPRGWRELVPDAGQRLRPVLLLLGVAFAARIVHGVVFVLAGMVDELTGNRTVVAAVLSVVGVALGTLAAGWAGARLARSARPRWGSGAMVWAPPLLAAFVLGITALEYLTAMRDGGQPAVSPGRTGAALAFWTAIVVAGGCWTIRLTQAHRCGRARLAAWGTGLAAVQGAAFTLGAAEAVERGLPLATGPLWFFTALVAPGGRGLAYGPLSEHGTAASTHVLAAVQPMAAILLLLTVFALRYGTGSARTSSARTSSARTGAVPAPPGTPARNPATPVWWGAAIAAAGLLLWAYTSALTTPAVATAQAIDEAPYGAGELHVWVHELRLAAILVAVLGLLCALAGRGATVVPVAVSGAALLVLDARLDAGQVTGQQVLLPMLAAGTAILGAGWWLGRTLPARPPDPPTARRALTGAAVVAAFAAPALSAHAVWPGGLAYLPTALPVGTAVAGALLAAVAGTTALTVRPLPRPLGTLVVATATLLAAALGAATYGLADYIFPGLALGAPYAAILVAVMRARPERPRTTMMTAAAVVLAAIPIAALQVIASLIVGPALMALAGFEFGADGIPVLSGTVIVAGLCGVIAGHRVAPRPPPTPDEADSTAAEAVPTR